MLWGMRQASFLTPLTRPIGWRGAAAVIAGAAMVAFALLGITALAGLVDWVRVLVVSRARRWEEVTAEMLAVDLVTVVLFLAASVGVIVLLMTPATRRDFQSSRQPPAATNGR
jgi:amino acid transporter